MTTGLRKSWPSWDKPLSMSFNEETPLEDVFKYVKQSTKQPGVPRWASDLRRPDRALGSRQNDQFHGDGTSTSKGCLSGRR